MAKITPARFQHQEQAFAFIKDRNIFALFMEMGTGKSKVTIDKAYHLNQQGLINCVIIISPNAVKDQWVTEQFPTHYPDNNWNGIIWDGMNTKYAKENFAEGLSDNENLFVFSTNVEAFQSSSIDPIIKMILSNKRCFIVIDESTKIKNGRRKPVKGKRSGAIRTNKILDLFARVPYKAILTGTPTPNNPFDLWSQFEFLKRDFFSMDYFIFTHHYGIMIQKATNEGKRYYTTLDEVTYNILKSVLKKVEKLDHNTLETLSIKYGMKTSDVLTLAKMEKYEAYKRLDELRDKLKTITFFVNKKDCLDLPDKVYETLTCEMSKEQSRVYKELKKEMFTEYATKELNVTSKLVMSLRLQMITGGLFPYSTSTIKVDKEGDEFMDTHFEYVRLEDNCKIKVLMEDIELVPADTSIIIWARFRGEIEIVTEALMKEGHLVDKYYGGSSIDVIDRFKNKEIRFLVANPLKGGEGLNLQVSSLQYFYSNSFKADSRLQAEDRSHRIGQVNKVTYKDLICKGTIDETVYNVLKRKESLINYFRAGGSIV